MGLIPLEADCLKNVFTCHSREIVKEHELNDWAAESVFCFQGVYSWFWDKSISGAWNGVLLCFIYSLFVWRAKEEIWGGWWLYVKNTVKILSSISIWCAKTVEDTRMILNNFIVRLQNVVNLLNVKKHVFWNRHDWKDELMRSHKEQPSNMIWKYVEMEQCEKQNRYQELR